MNLLSALVLEAILPGPQLLMALGNYVSADEFEIGGGTFRCPPGSQRVGDTCLVAGGAAVPPIYVGGGSSGSNWSIPGLAVIGLGVAGLIWWWSRSARPSRRRRLRRNPTPYTKAWKALIDAEHAGAPESELRRLRTRIEEERERSRSRWADDKTEAELEALVARRRR